MYENYMNNYNPYMQKMQNQTMMQQQKIIHVNGENGARAFRMMPNSEALLLDDTQAIVWLCQSDGAGYHTVTPYSITPYEQPQEIDYNSVIKSLDERLRILEGNYESNIATTEQYVSDKNVGNVKQSITNNATV